MSTTTNAKQRLKQTAAFRSVSRGGRWAHRGLLSIGVKPSGHSPSRIGLRTRRGLKGAVVRNRLKRQIRALVQQRRAQLKDGLDIVIVIHPPGPRVDSKSLETELVSLWKKLGIMQDAPRCG